MMQGAAATLSTQPAKKPFKQVRYQDDEERFEDREDILPYNPSAPQTHRPPARGEHPQTQYVLKSKTNSANSEARNHPSPPQPVRSIPLPSGPSYDPQDEEDLRRETTYQQELKNRVNTLQRTAESTVIPHIDSSESDDLLPTEMEQEAGPCYQHHRDLLSMYDEQRVSQNMYAGAPSWGETGYSQPQGYSNPQGGYSNPQGGYSNPEAGYSKPQSYATAAQRGYADPEDYAGGGYSRTQPGYGESYDRERYEGTDYPGPASHLPRDDYTEDVQQEHSGQHGSPTRGMMGTYSQQGYAEPRDGYYLTEPRGYTQSQKPAPIYNQAFTGQGSGERGAHQAPSPTMDDHPYQVEEDAQQRPNPPQFSGLITLPTRPDYDYVSHNKVDYGFSQKRTYKKISEVKRHEEERLSHIFVHPTVRPTAKKGSRDNSPIRPVNSTGQPPLAITYSPTGEGAVQGQDDLWTRPSPHLSQSVNPKLSPTHSLPFTHPVDITQPSITQHLVTEDGQRISVDVNLRLVSPPVGSEGEEFTDQPHFRQTGMQYPMIQPGGRTPRDLVHSGSHDYRDPVYTTTVTTNPYKKIPPIGTGFEGSPNSAPAQSEGSYMLSYLRDREKQMGSQNKPWYRIYGLKDYKRMQKEMQLGRGTLGPDLENDTFREKRDKMLRKLDYAKAVKDKNMKELMNRKPPTFPRPKERDDMLSKRKLAVEYAKHVPKPTVKPKATAHNSYELASKLSPIAKSSWKGQQQANGQDKVSNGSVEVLDLDKLHKRHQQDKRSAHLIQQKAQGVVS